MGTNITLPSSGGSGFTYDQVTLPSAPTMGQTWRQRDGSNLVINDWFWNGTYWIETVRKKFNIASSNTTPVNLSTYTNSLLSIISSNYGVLIEKFIITGNLSVAHNTSNYREFSFDYRDFSLFPGLTTELWTVGFNKTESSFAPQIAVGSQPNYFQVVNFPTGNPSVITRNTATVLYRNVYL